MIRTVIVDDEPRIRDGLSTLIEWGELGFIVVDKAANGIEAMNKYKSLEPDLIIADIRMPEMNGLELVRAIRSAGGTMHVLILSGYADFEYAKQAMTLRIDGYLLKPVDEERLARALDRVRGQWHQRQALAQREQLMALLADLTGKGEIEAGALAAIAGAPTAAEGLALILASAEFQRR